MAIVTSLTLPVTPYLSVILFKMATNSPRHITLPPRNIMDISEDNATTSQPPGQRGPPLTRHDSGRISIHRQSTRRPSQGIPFTRTFTGGSGGRSGRDVEAQLSPVSERPPIPNALSSGGFQGLYSTPLPKLPMIVLSIVRENDYCFALFS